MKPTKVLITGTYDNRENEVEEDPEAESSTEFEMCDHGVATYISVYLLDEHGNAEPVSDHRLEPDPAKAKVDAMFSATEQADIHGVDILNRFFKEVIKPPAVTYFARLLGKAKWEVVSKAEFDSYQMGSLYETKTEPVCDVAAWYEEAMAASNELGYAGMDAASVIRHMGQELAALKADEDVFKEVIKELTAAGGQTLQGLENLIADDRLKAMAQHIAKGALGIEWRDTESQARRVAEHAAEEVCGYHDTIGSMGDKLKQVTEVDRCEGCDGTFLGVNRETKWCPFCGKKHEGETVKVALMWDAETTTFECIGKGGSYRLLGQCTGAGTSKGVSVEVYRDIPTGRLFHRTSTDWDARMQVKK